MTWTSLKTHFRVGDFAVNQKSSSHLYNLSALCLLKRVGTTIVLWVYKAILEFWENPPSFLKFSKTKKIQFRCIKISSCNTTKFETGGHCKYHMPLSYNPSGRDRELPPAEYFQGLLWVARWEYSGKLLKAIISMNQSNKIIPTMHGKKYGKGICSGKWPLVTYADMEHSSAAMRKVCPTPVQGDGVTLTYNSILAEA